MNSLIKNRDRLLAHGFTAGRKIAIDIVVYALQRVNARQAVKNKVHLVDNVLKIEDQSFNLQHIRHIYAIGGGKATLPLAVALEEILGERITDGFIAVKDGQLGRLKRIRVMEAAHPVPDHRSVAAGRQVLDVAKKAGPDDLVICLMSGGVSSPYLISGR